MWNNQGTGNGMANLGQMTRPWIGALQALANAAGISLTPVQYALTEGANELTPAILELPSTPTGFAVIVLYQPGDQTITWSSDFLGTVNGIDQTAGTYSVFFFIALCRSGEPGDSQWLMLCYPTTGWTS
jgi:hypothetical protein